MVYPHRLGWLYDVNMKSTTSRYSLQEYHCFKMSKALPDNLGVLSSCSFAGHLRGNFIKLISKPTNESVSWQWPLGCYIPSNYQLVSARPPNIKINDQVSHPFNSRFIHFHPFRVGQHNSLLASSCEKAHQTTFGPGPNWQVSSTHVVGLANSQPWIEAGNNFLGSHKKTSIENTSYHIIPSNHKAQINMFVVSVAPSFLSIWRS